MNQNYNECPICLCNAKLPVVTGCGHIFCWECIKQWVNVKGLLECPVCKGGIKLNEVIKLYTGNSETTKDEVDDRPQQERSKPQHTDRNIFNRIANNLGLNGYSNDTTFRLPTQKEVQKNRLTLIVSIIIIVILILIFKS